MAQEVDEWWCGGMTDGGWMVLRQSKGSTVLRVAYSLLLAAGARYCRSAETSPVTSTANLQSSSWPSLSGKAHIP
jgi:hypothetical protein